MKNIKVFRTIRYQDLEFEYDTKLKGLYPVLSDILLLTNKVATSTSNKLLFYVFPNKQFLWKSTIETITYADKLKVGNEILNNISFTDKSGKVLSDFYFDITLPSETFNDITLDPGLFHFTILTNTIPAIPIFCNLNAMDFSTGLIEQQNFYLFLEKLYSIDRDKIIYNELAVDYTIPYNETQGIFGGYRSDANRVEING